MKAANEPQILHAEAKPANVCRGEQLRLQCVVSSHLAFHTQWVRALFRNGTHGKLLTHLELYRLRSSLQSHEPNATALHNSNSSEPNPFYDLKV